MEPSNLVTAFTVWAAVVALMGGAMVIELRALRMELREMKDALNNHIVDTTERLTALEAFNKMHHGFDPIHRRRRDD